MGTILRRLSEYKGVELVDGNRSCSHMSFHTTQLFSSDGFILTSNKENLGVYGELFPVIGRIYVDA